VSNQSQVQMLATSEAVASILHGDVLVSAKPQLSWLVSPVHTPVSQQLAALVP
jgi:hypothetical protein